MSQDNLNIRHFNDVVRETTYINENQENNFDEFYRSSFENTNYQYFIERTNELSYEFFNIIQPNAINDIMNTNVKIIFTLEVEMSRLNEENITFYINTEMRPLLILDNKEDFYQNACNELLNNIEIAELKGSGWHFQRIN